jgi:hypothetical protein
VPWWVAFPLSGSSAVTPGHVPRSIPHRVSPHAVRQARARNTEHG